MKEEFKDTSALSTTTKEEESKELPSLSKSHFEQVLAEPENKRRKTKIVCTIGPACMSPEKLCDMINAGMDVARFNFSHGDHEYHKKALITLREAMKKTGKTCATMLDTKGPEIRTGLLKSHGNIKLEKGQRLEISTNYELEGDSKIITCSWKNLPLKVKVGSLIYIADGSLTCVVTEVKPPDLVVVRVENDAEIGEKKNMNCPGTDVDLPTIGEKDEADIVDFALKHGMDMIAASFIRSPDDVEAIRDLLGPRGSHIMIISKIENHQGLFNYDAILKASDGIMVARGDLGMEVSPEKVFVCQKWMIEKANIAGKPVITATQMLESMVHNPRPTRAEASDVANAVLDGTDCVMLSGETANGAHPLQSVEIMSKICREAERCTNYELVQEQMRKLTTYAMSTREAICQSAARLALDINADLVIVLTENGESARLIAKYRPKQPILTCSTSMSIIKQLNTTRGIIGFKIPSFQGTDNLLKSCIVAAKEMGLCKSGNKVVVIHSTKEEDPGISNLMKILDIDQLSTDSH